MTLYVVEVLSEDPWVKSMLKCLDTLELSLQCDVQSCYIIFPTPCQYSYKSQLSAVFPLLTSVPDELNLSLFWKDINIFHIRIEA